MVRDDLLERPHETEKEVHKNDVKLVKMEKAAVDVDQWDKWFVYSFDSLEK